MDKLHGTWKNRIFCVAVLVFVFIMAAQAMHNGMFTALALEQPARCGLEEHVHTEECYIDHVLICEKKAHTHSENCYLLLLEDNDINWLLSAVDSTVDNNLNSVIESAVFQALTSDSTDEEIATNFAETLQTSLTIGTAAAYTTAYTTALTTTGFFFTDVVETTAYETTAPVATLYALENTTIPTLNTTITENNIQPAVVLNENLVSTMAVADTADNAVAVADVVKSSDSDRSINFYIRLDGSIECIYTGRLTDANPDYFSYTNTVNAYKDVVTDLATDNINSTYYFRYNRDGDTSTASDFDIGAGYENNNVTFGNKKQARYAILTTRTWSVYRYTYTPVDFYKVTLDLSAVGEEDSVQYVQDGLSPELSDEYHWYTDAAGTNQIETSTYTVADTTTLYAKPKGYTVTYIDPNGNETKYSHTSGETHTVLKPPDGYKWSDASGNVYEDGETVNKNVTLTADIYRVTVTYDGSTETYWKKIGDTVALLPGYVWSDGTDTYEGSVTITVTEPTNFVGTPKLYTVTYIDENGDRTEKSGLRYGTTVTLPDNLPDGYVWDDGTATYQGGASVTVTGNQTFTAKAKTIQVVYTVNFPTGQGVKSIPTIYGTTSDTATDTVTGGNSTVTRMLTSRIAERVLVATTDACAVYFFRGWRIDGTNTIVDPGARLTWQELDTYDTDGTVNLVGVWTDGSTAGYADEQSVGFYIRYDSVAVDVGGSMGGQSAEKYTNSILNTYVGGLDAEFSTDSNNDALNEKYGITDSTADNSFAADQAIRALYGEKASGVWLYDFPTDAEVFEFLRNDTNVSNLKIDGVTVPVANLDSDHYTVRWYVFKKQDDSWHIDGRLVEKEANITVDKEFYGDATAIAKAESGFYISAVNGTQDEDGNFIEYTSADADFKQYVLVLDTATQTTLQAQYPNATVILFDSDASSTDAHSYEWLIEGVTLGEYWQITEHLTSDVNGYAWYAEYSIYDTDGVVTAIAEYGTTASVAGKTFALDEDPDQGLFVDFRNYYYPDNSMLIKKEDGETGQPIGGATFELWQYNSDGELVQLKFSVDEDGNYEMDNDGSITQISTGTEGYTTIKIEDFSYAYGDVLVKEVGAPAGYDAAPNITLKATEAGVLISDVRYDGAEKELDNSNLYYAEVYEDGSVLIVKDYSSKSTSVTVSKVWDGDTTADSVKIVLQVNGSHANAVFPSLKNVEVELSADNNWTYTWEDLPAYANGAPAEWSVKETVIGSEVTTSDGVTFANWIVAYSAATKTDADGDGITDNWSYTVTNTVRRTLLYLNKVDSSGAALTGAAFTLELVNVKNGAFVGTGTFITALATDSVGQFKFDNLTAGAYYRLTETTAPRGYFGMDDSVVIKVDSAGLVQLAEIVNGSVQTSTLSGVYVNYTVPYNIAFTNRAAQPLPETGGGGTFLYTCGGLLLMAASLLLYKALRRREEFPDV